MHKISISQAVCPTKSNRTRHGCRVRFDLVGQTACDIWHNPDLTRAK